MDNFVPLFAVMTCVALGWFFVRAPTVFVIKVRQGIPRVIRGRATNSVVQAIQEICEQNLVTKGTITATQMGPRKLRLRFTADISPGCQQQIRNLIIAGSANDVRLSGPH